MALQPSNGQRPQQQTDGYRGRRIAVTQKTNEVVSFLGAILVKDKNRELFSQFTRSQPTDAAR